MAFLRYKLGPESSIYIVKVTTSAKSARHVPITPRAFELGPVTERVRGVTLLNTLVRLLNTLVRLMIEPGRGWIPFLMTHLKGKGFSQEA